ncbi:sugar dehydrogenase complex small subunit [Histidinibacterium lentulum]|uniref:Gluconate 2-dehydrogenase subunit 3 family protein n=1 Tax=Histidinibacterium lentulum TaxID=2480588 RepID=A0A3N2R8W5_9RHOB|nr:sugar dehydrogenase complex small subunit [Histidinibacterium lentulum]ROU03776.1 hypothetical protein EAT49_05640 [Histidinibacterium lentulum]
MTEARLSRRSLLAGGLALSALATAAPLRAQVARVEGPSFVDLAARLRELTGFDPLPRDLLSAFAEASGEDGVFRAGIMEDGDAAAQRRAIKALYHGILAPEGDEGEPVRLGYASALQWAAIEETNNVPSWCGGVPGYWSEPPELPG